MGFLEDGKLIDIAWKIGQMLLILLIGYVAIRIVMRITKRVLMRSNLDEALHTFICNTARIALWILLIVTILGYLNVSIAAFVTVLGAAGAAIALALKDSLSNFAGGLLILFHKPFGKGDYITCGSDEGTVENIDLLYTTMKTLDNKVVTIPNGILANSAVTNYSKEPARRVSCRFGIGYECDVDQAMDILAAVAESDERIYRDPAPVIGVAAQEDSCVAIDLLVWCDNDDIIPVKYYLQRQVKIAFDEQGISIPYPQLDVHNVK
ncbi:MAG: mechanosensitive ion channel family protein [Anaerovoracaceae bacterium]|nr:mechanosensitive ion channel family protein [Bacillota bacterium]MDY3954657.1 mechanosensitive ion channel family protein [Anaerovoracaceae bacterium]